LWDALAGASQKASREKQVMSLDLTFQLLPPKIVCQTQPRKACASPLSLSFSLTHTLSFYLSVCLSLSLLSLWADQRERRLSLSLCKANVSFCYCNNGRRQVTRSLNGSALCCAGGLRLNPLQRERERLSLSICKANVSFCYCNQSVGRTGPVAETSACSCPTRVPRS